MLYVIVDPAKKHCKYYAGRIEQGAYAKQPRYVHRIQDAHLCRSRASASATLRFLRPFAPAAQVVEVDPVTMKEVPAHE